MRVILSTPVRQPRLRDRRLFLRVLHEAAELTGLAALPRFAAPAELAVILVGPRTMSRLNAAFRGHAGSTDVLAFPWDGTIGDLEPGAAGEIYICPAVAATAARRFRTSLAHECVLYAVHGMLHLAGLDDEEPAARRAMRRAERRVMERLRAGADFRAIFGSPAADRIRERTRRGTSGG
jgi:rRNA maturation RNase YbeY